MTENRVLNPYEAAKEFTMWSTETMWLPFVEDEDGNITGPGHQNRLTFALQVNEYYYRVSFPDYGTITYDDVSHTYGQVYDNESGEFWVKPAEPHDPGAVAITTVWRN